MIPLHAEVRRLLAQFDDRSVAHVRREENRHADKLVNDVLDARAAAELERRTI
jgi:ribonuclease HI